MNESDTDDELIEYLRNLDEQETQLPQPNDEEEGREASLNDSIEAHLDHLADQHMQEEDSKLDSDSSDDWRTGGQVLLRNPFAAQETTSPKKATAAHQGYFTEQGLLKQQQRLEAIRREAGVKSSSVLIERLNSKDLLHHLRHHDENQEDSAAKQPKPANTMSAKNITKDRSTSRGRTGNQDRFSKGREDQQPEPEDMDQDQGNQGEKGGANAKGNGKRQRDPP